MDDALKPSSKLMKYKFTVNGIVYGIGSGAALSLAFLCGNRHARGGVAVGQSAWRWIVAEYGSSEGS